MTVDEPSEIRLIQTRPAGPGAMNEQEWLTGTDPFAMCAVPAVAANHRKARLFAVACCRRLADWFPDPRLRQAVAAAEKYADGKLRLATLGRWNTVAAEAQGAVPRAGGNPFPPEWQAAYAVVNATHADEHVSCARQAMIAWRTLNQAEGVPVEEIRDWLARHLRDVFGNPFRPAAFAPDWRTSTAVQLAGRMYEARDFGTMPILADALQDAGCEDAAVLDHCRGPGPHVRGCWVVDLVLGKA